MHPVSTGPGGAGLSRHDPSMGAIEVHRPAALEETDFGTRVADAQAHAERLAAAIVDLDRQDLSSRGAPHRVERVAFGDRRRPRAASSRRRSSERGGLRDEDQRICRQLEGWPRTPAGAWSGSFRNFVMAVSIGAISFVEMVNSPLRQPAGEIGPRISPNSLFGSEGE